MKVSLICPICKSKFEKEEKYINFSIKKDWKIYCSNECKHIGKAKEYNYKCANCGKDLIVTPSRIKRSKTGNLYCSKKCSTIKNNTLFKKWENHPQYKNGISSYRWIKIKSMKELKCEECNFDNPLALEVHHKDRNRKNNNLDNLQLLCCNCHTIKHKTGSGLIGKPPHLGCGHHAESSSVYLTQKIE